MFFVADYLSVAYDGAPFNASHRDLGTFEEVLFGTASGIGWVGPSAMLTGWIILIVLCIMVFFAMPLPTLPCSHINLHVNQTNQTLTSNSSRITKNIF